MGRQVEEDDLIEPDGRAGAVDRSELILEAAIDEFGRRGFAGARVDHIAELAGVNKQLIYYYFENKVGLYDAVFREIIARSHKEREDLGDVALVTRVKRMNEPQQATSVVWHRFWLWEALENEPGAALMHEDERVKVWDELVQQVRRAQRDGEVDSRFDPMMLALALHSVTSSPHVLPQITRMLTGVSHLSEDFAVRQGAFLADLVKHLAPEGPGGSAADDAATTPR